MVQRYPTDLTEAEWTLLAPLIPVAQPGGRPRTTDMREVVNAIFYVLRGGCQWRQLPTEFPPNPTANPYFLTSRLSGGGRRLHDRLRRELCEVEGAVARQPAGGTGRGCGPYAGAQCGDHR